MKKPTMSNPSFSQRLHQSKQTLDGYKADPGIPGKYLDVIGIALFPDWEHRDVRQVILDQQDAWLAAGSNRSARVRAHLVLYLQATAHISLTVARRTAEHAVIAAILHAIRAGIRLL